MVEFQLSLLQKSKDSILNFFTNVSILDLKEMFLKNKLKSSIYGCCSLLIFRYILLKIQRKLYSYPPGPIGLPFIGYFGHKMLWFKYNFKRFTNTELGKRYGEILMFYNFSWKPPIVFISSASLARKLLNYKPNKNFTNRGHILNREATDKIDRNTIDILANNDNEPSFGALNYNQWLNRRKLAQNSLLSMCTSSYVNKILHNTMNNTAMPEIDKLIKINKLWYPRKLMSYCAFNTIFHASFGRPVDIDDEDGIKLRDLIDQTFRLFGSFKPLIWDKLRFPARLFPSWFKPMKVLECRRQRCELIRKLIKERESREYDENKPVSYIDHMLVGLKSNIITRAQMEADIGILFSAGTDTTASALEHAVVFAAKYPSIQVKVRNELLKHFQTKIKVNNKLQFDISLLSKIPLFRAYVKEVLRISCVAQAGLFHNVNNNDIWIKINGNKTYRIPAKARINYSITNVHLDNDKENWINSEKRIVLENWLEIDDTKEHKISFKMNKSEMTFGYGHRNCVGQMLAMKELHIIFGYLLLNYEFSFDNVDDPEKVEIKASQRGVVVIDPQIGIKVTHCS